MLIVEVRHLDGSTERLHVEQAQFIRLCPYPACGREFRTLNQDQVYCSKYHQIYAWNHKHFGTIAEARGILTTVGIVA